uniref:Uncharacterized protein n=1 Tax=Candidatus Kentrum sp. DK TaxID=2126562 RepID=A0A450T268_9GAMM|nr:MAG: hypothetical protein BECKDK2373C_GA0170839_10834 [Candidatus Kentron sp. DK]
MASYIIGPYCPVKPGQDQPTTNRWFFRLQSLFDKHVMRVKLSLPRQNVFVKWDTHKDADRKEMLGQRLPE